MAERKSSALLATGIGVGIAAAIYTVVWFVSAHLLQGEVERWLAARRTEDFTIRTGTLASTGFPFRVAVRVPDLDLAAPPQKGKWTWQTPAVEVSASPAHLSRLTIDLSGTHSIASPWLESPPLRFTAAEGRLTIDLDGDGQVTATQLNIGNGDGSWNSDHSRLHVDKAAVRISLNPPAEVPAAPASGPVAGPMPAVSSRLDVNIENLTVPGSLPAPLSTTLKQVTFTADVVGPVGSGTLPKILDAWNNAGGAVNLKDFTLDWPPLAIAGEGSIALDQNLQPMGAFTTRVRGFAAGIDIMVEQHRMDRKEAALAKGVLGMMSKPSTGGETEISVPLTVQDRMLSAGPVKLFEIPHVTWPGGAPP
ncbi:MAG: DUF2125 domain-containing protein [Rhodospirillaceae bacterium]